MTSVIISGYHGRMGRALRAAIAENAGFADFEVVAGFDVGGLGDADGAGDAANDADAPLFSAPEADVDSVPRADVIIDFSNYAFVPKVLRYAILTGTPTVVATTALGEQERALLREASGVAPMFHSANMSLGVNLVAEMAKLTAPVVEDGWGIEIIEKHHNQKKDAPSGTAILLADAINDSLKTRKEMIFGRYGKDTAPSLSEIGIHAVRGGSIPGQHTVMFAGPDEVIEITHTVYSNKVFAAGALAAAAFLLTKPAGLYDMDDLLAPVR